MDTYGGKPNADQLLHDLMRIMAPAPYGADCNKFARRFAGGKLRQAHAPGIQGPIERVTDAVQRYADEQHEIEAADRSGLGQ